MPRKSEKQIAPDELNRVFVCDPDAGKLYWRARDDVGQSWNTRWAGKEAFTSTTAAGYRHGRLHRTAYYAHHVVYAMAHGVWPTQVDHINGDTSDNRIENLRECTQRDNCRNQKARRDGFPPGVTRAPNGTHWHANISERRDGRRIGTFLGTFMTMEDAAKARKKAEQDRGYHPNHGRHI